MKACGVVAEYNPFHNGHAYQIEQARRQSDAEVVIAVMSGNFLQRGEPAIVDKWTRAQMALIAGVDLIIELPVMWSTQPADYFAQGAIRLLHALNIDYLSFGVEEGTASEFLAAADFLLQNEEKITAEIDSHPDMNMSYAQKVEELVYQLNPDFPIDLASPNVQLALSYQKAIIELGMAQGITLLPIQRKGAAYAEKKIDYHPTIASATAIRKAVFNKKSVSNYLVDATNNFFVSKLDEKVSWESYFPYLKYELIAKSTLELKEIYQMTEGLENRLKSKIYGATSFQEFMTSIKTKRYTQTRLQRLLVYILLNIKSVDVEKTMQTESALRVLGFNQKGRQYLNQQKDKLTVPLIANVNRETKKILKHDIRAGEIYRLGCTKIEKQDFSRKPLIFD